jgi:hypothetical protein
MLHGAEIPEKKTVVLAAAHLIILHEDYFLAEAVDPEIRMAVWEV